MPLIPRWKKTTALLMAMLGGFWVGLPAQDLLAIRGGRVVPIAGKTFEDGVILIRDGKIAALGTGIEIPVDAKVIDAKGKVILPGFVEAHSAGAMSQPNEVNPNVPFLSVVDTIDPVREYFEECRRNGVTTVAVVPGNSTMIGGQAAVIKTAGTYVDEMILKRQAGMKISLLPANNGSRMSHYARLRAELQRARNALDGIEEPKDAATENRAAATNPETPNQPAGNEQPADANRQPDPSTTEAQRAAMVQLLKGDFPAFIYCSQGMDVVQALKLIDTYKLKAILVLGRECYQAADLVAASKLPAILDETLVYWRTDPRTGKDERIVLPQLFHQKKVPLTFQVSSATSATLGNSYLWYQAATAVKYGMPRDDALRAITLVPAEMLGVAGFVGSIEPNKDADLVILSGEPLRVNTWVETTLVNGRIVYERSKDEKLKRLIEKPAS